MEQGIVTHEKNPYQIMDRMDDNIIEAELENRIIDTWVYSFTGSDGRQQTGLSKVGVDASCTEMAKQGNVIREGKVEYKRDPTNSEFMLFQGLATRYFIDHEGNEVEMESVNGTKRQWIKMKLRDGSIMDDPFWFEKGAMKALRNARARLIPEEIRTKIITLAKDKGRIKNIDSENEENQQINCPECGKPAIIKGKPEYGGGWLCYKKKDGCGAKWSDKEWDKLIKTNKDKFEGQARFLRVMAKFQKTLLTQTYHKILGEHGFTNANEITKRADQEKVYIAMKEAEPIDLDKEDIPY